MDGDDIVEIPPPIHFVKKKKKCAISHVVFDNGDDSDDLVLIGEKVSKSNKGKAIMHDVIEIDDNDDSDDLFNDNW